MQDTQEYIDLRKADKYQTNLSTYF